MFLNRSRSTIFVEDAFGDARKDVDHGVHTFFLGLFREVHNTPTVRKELAVKEFVHEVELDNDVDQAKAFAGKVAEGIQVMSLEQKFKK